MKRSELQVGTEVAIRWGSFVRVGVVLSVFPEIYHAPASYHCTVAVRKANDGSWLPVHVPLAYVLCDWPTYLRRQEAEKAQKRVAGTARKEALVATAKLADRLGLEIRFSDWGVYIDDVFLSYLTPSGTVPEALFLRALKMVDQERAPDA